MAGNYPDVPSYRMPYDRDGTALVRVTGGTTVAQLSSADAMALNNETDNGVAAGGAGQSSGLVFIFPELRDVDGYFAAGQAGGYGANPTWTVQVSANTTNGVDGTWTQIAAAYNGGTVVSTAYRNAIQSCTALSMKAVRLLVAGGDTSNTMVVAHFYGEISPSENPNRLALWHPTLDQRITPSYFDWGNVPRGSSADRTFRIKNLSTVQTANSVRVAQEILTDTTPSVVGQHTLSTDGATFFAQVNVGALAPGAASGVVTLRRVTPSDAVLSLWCHRVFAEATTWS